METEFRIFHNIFCDPFKIQRKAFAFNEYVEKVFEKFVMSIIEIRPIDWFSVSLIFTMNLLRLSVKLNFQKCGLHDYNCRYDMLSKGFPSCGLVLLTFTVAVALLSRYLERQIMRRHGISNLDCYYSYLHVSGSIFHSVVLHLLQYMEGKNSQLEDSSRMDAQQLKAVVEALKSKSLQRNLDSFFPNRKANTMASRLSIHLPSFQLKSPNKTPVAASPLVDDSSTHSNRQ